MQLQTGLGPSAGTFKASLISTINIWYLFLQPWLVFPFHSFHSTDILIGGSTLHFFLVKWRLWHQKIQLQTGLGPSAGTFNGSWDMKAINSLDGNRWRLMSSTSVSWLFAHESRDLFRAETSITLSNLTILNEKIYFVCNSNYFCCCFSTVTVQLWECSRLQGINHLHNTP